MDGSPDAPGVPTVHVGRQPIYDRAGDVVAYELLFRDTVDATSASRRSAQATSQVIVSAFTGFGLEQLVGSRACFINVTGEFLTGELPLPFDSGQAVLEIMETVDIDDHVVGGVKRLVQRGFTIALDDFTLGAHERLLDLATYVKINLLDTDSAMVDAILRRCGEHPQIQFIAERLETEDQLHRAFETGFELFQGHILGRPHIVSTSSINPGRLQRLQLLNALSASEIDFEEIVSLIASDPAITYRLLQACNSAASGLSNKVSTVHGAAILLGVDTIRQWVTLIVLSDVADATEDQLAVTITRARVCHDAAEEIGLSPDVAFTTGLLSGIADILGQPSAELANHLPLTTDIHHALTDGTGDLGALLIAVRNYQHGQPAALAAMTSPDQATNLYLGAIRWSTRLIDQASAGTETARKPESRISQLLKVHHW